MNKNYYTQKYGIIGESKAIYNILDDITKVAPFDVSVSIFGESGTGKELVAKAIHYESKRKNEKFIAVNCGAFVENLLESELFGHVRGAFTGAVQQRNGVLYYANKGTLFLDEVTEMSPKLQVKLLRVLQEGTYTPLGENNSVHTNIRIITASNKPLEDLLNSGLFREDLYYRIKIYPINIPPLRQRTEDIIPIADYICKKLSYKHQRAKYKIDDSAEDILKKYPWPGNVRELENIIERAIIMLSNLEDFPKTIINRTTPNKDKDDHRLEEQDKYINELPEYILRKEHFEFLSLMTQILKLNSELNYNFMKTTIEDFAIKKADLDTITKAYILTVLEITNNKKEAARILGLSKTTLWRKRKELSNIFI